MGKTLSAHQMLKKKYESIPIDSAWAQAIGLPEPGFKMLVWGAPGQGKTTFVVKLCKELTRFGKVYYNSIEQGESASLQRALIQCRIEDCKPGSFMIGDRHDFEVMNEKLKNNRAKFIVIDSLDYMNLTKGQYQRLTESFPKKSFIIVSWQTDGGAPKSQHAKSIRYMVDIKTYVKKGIASTESRFGATKPYQIFNTSTELFT